MWLAEAGAHLGQVDLWDVEELAVPVKATLEREAVPVRIPSLGPVTAAPRKLSGALKYDDRRCAEVPYQPVEETADLPVKAPVAPKEDARDRGEAGAVARPRGGRPCS